MSRQIATSGQRLPTTRRPRNRDAAYRSDDSADAPAMHGWLIIAAFFGLLGSWALVAPLNGAVVAQAVVKIDGNRKAIQHLEGGIVKALNIKEGDTVRVGDTLVVLDGSQARAELDVLDQLGLALMLTEARLKAEQEGRDVVTLPPALTERSQEPQVAAALRGQQMQLDTRRRELAGQGDIIRQRIGQLEAQIGGAQAQSKGLRGQRESVAKELQSLAPLLEQGIVTRTRLLALERNLAALDGQLGEVAGSIAKAQQGVAEQMQIEAQGGNQRATAIAQELRDVQMRLAEVLPKLANARAVNERTVVRAPYAGRVVGLNVFAVGAVIGRGEKLMEIVPEGGSLIVEARIAVEDVTEVKPQHAAEVRLTGYKQQTTPPLRGQVISVSADRLTDQRTGAPYYLANLEIDADELERHSEIVLYPGMPATALIPTAPRTAFQYLIAPLSASFDVALRER